jgi:biopolymer transport protein ExbD
VTYLRSGKSYSTPVKLIKNEFISTEFKGIELIDIDSADKKRLGTDYGVKIKEIKNEQLEEYANELQGAIILRIGKNKAVDVETVSRILSQISETQSVQIELITQAGQRVRVII